MEGAYFKLDESNYDYPAVLLVEGKDDAMLLDIVLSSMAVSAAEVRVIVCGGKAGFSKHLPLLIKSFAFQFKIKAIAIFRDADADAAVALSEVHAQLSHNGLPTPGRGSSLDQEGRRIGVYLFPSNDGNGDLEALALSLAAESPTLKDSEAYINGVIARDAELGRASKRKVQAFLSGASKEIRPTVGWAFKDGTIPINLNDVPDLVSFIKEVLRLEAQ